MAKSVTGVGRRGRRPGPMGPAQLAAVADLFAALAAPGRLRVLQVLQAGPAGVGDLVGRTGLKQANLSKQLATLLAAGVVARRQEGTRAIYSIDMPVVFDLCDLVCRTAARRAADRAADLGGRPSARRPRTLVRRPDAAAE